MSPGRLRVPLLVLLASGCWAVGRALTVDFHPPEPTQGSAAAGSSRTRQAGAGTPSADLLTHASARPLFRADRRPSDIRYRPDSATAPEAAAVPAEPRPTLALSGIVRGSRPAAVLSGVPGTEGEVVLRPGDSAGGLRLVRIDGDRAIVRGRDTTWRLTVRNPWP